jgi:hypothetical protein
MTETPHAITGGPPPPPTCGPSRKAHRTCRRVAVEADRRLATRKYWHGPVISQLARSAGLVRMAARCACRWAGEAAVAAAASAAAHRAASSARCTAAAAASLGGATGAVSTVR